MFDTINRLSDEYGDLLQAKRDVTALTARNQELEDAAVVAGGDIQNLMHLIDEYCKVIKEKDGQIAELRRTISELNHHIHDPNDFSDQ